MAEELSDAQREAIGSLVDYVNKALPPTFIAYWSTDGYEDDNGVYGGLMVGRVDGQMPDPEEEAMLRQVVTEAVTSWDEGPSPYTIKLGEVESVESARVDYMPEERDLMEEVLKGDHRGFE